MTHLEQLAAFDAVLAGHNAALGFERGTGPDVDLWRLLGTAMVWCEAMGVSFHAVLRDAADFHAEELEPT